MNSANPFDAIERLATTPILLVASDYDGTLAPIVNDPKRAFPQHQVMVALKSLASMPHTHVAVISGRALRDLAMLTGSPAAVHLVGSHGSEFEPGFADHLDPADVERLDSIQNELTRLADGHAGVDLESKPASVAFHYRNAAEKDHDLLAATVRTAFENRAGIYLNEGKKVVEVSVISTDKGLAMKCIRQRVGASAALYLGDDRTDEDAFDVLSGPDVGIKIGDGSSAAEFHLSDPEAVARFLAQLTEQRAAWLAGSSAEPIESHSVLSDQRTAVVETSRARMTWFCAPRLDSPAVFAELVGGPTAGYFDVGPANDEEPVHQEYLKDTFHLCTEWSTFAVTDYLDCSGGRPMQRAGRSDVIRKIEGEGDVRISFAPRLDFGRVQTRLNQVEGGLEVEDSLDPIVLRAPGVEWSIAREGQHDTAEAIVTLDPNAPLVLELRCGTGDVGGAPIAECNRSGQTEQYWRSWMTSLTDPLLDDPLLRRSALVLKGLCHGPTGGIAAAATTSLPEHYGGVRNWDYRYCWVRDGAMTAEALTELGSLSEGMQFLDWVLGVIDRTGSPDQLRPVYSLAGEELGTEAEITELAGYGGSRPVRVGNAACRQVQLDVFGPLVQLIDGLVARGAPLSSEHWRLVAKLVETVARRWREPDHGIWEVRGPRRHFVHSKVMCWVAVDRGIRIAQRLAGEERQDWIALRDEIAEDVTTQSWKPEVNSFVAAYDGTDLDASTLFIGLTGMLPPEDSRFRATVETIERYLRDGPVVYRYRFEDGLPGTEGGFHICTTWLIQSLVLIGERARAAALYDELIALQGPTGLFSEEYDPKEKRALGNHPQAYTHLGILQSARALAADGQPFVQGFRTRESLA